jgi:hypothetical protein
MDRNPYSPPQTEVREAVEPDRAGPRPGQVTWAVRLFWAEFILSLLDVALVWYTKPADFERVADVVGAVVTLPLEALVIYKIGCGRNWARYVALASVLLSILLWFGVARQGISGDAVTVILGAMELLLDAVALLLIFANPGRQWFKAVTSR